MILLAAALGAAVGCGPSEQEVRLQKLSDELKKELAEQKQYNQDLKLRMQLVQARNRVLIDLVHGLTSDPDKLPAGANAALMPAHSSLQALDADLEGLVASVQHSKADMDALRKQRAALSTELEQAKHTIEATQSDEAKAQARADSFRDLLGKLSTMIGHGELDVRIVQNRMLLQLPEAFLFKSNDARVTRDGKLLLDRVAEVLKSVPAREFQIAGHTDSKPVRYGSFHDNWQLSSARALNVMLYLVERGVPKARLSAAAHADTQPIADEATPEGRSKNRRIEIVLLPNLEELPDLSSLDSILHKPAEPAPAETPTDTPPPTAAASEPAPATAPPPSAAAPAGPPAAPAPAAATPVPAAQP